MYLVSICLEMRNLTWAAKLLLTYNITHWSVKHYCAGFTTVLWASCIESPITCTFSWLSINLFAVRCNIGMFIDAGCCESVISRVRLEISNRFQSQLHISKQKVHQESKTFSSMAVVSINSHQLPTLWRRWCLCHESVWIEILWIWYLFGCFILCNIGFAEGVFIAHWEDLRWISSCDSSFSFHNTCFTFYFVFSHSVALALPQVYLQLPHLRHRSFTP